VVRLESDTDGETPAYLINRRYALSIDAIDGQVAGLLLRSARLRLGLSQTGFADVLGIAQPTLSAYESGRRQPTLPTLLGMLNRVGLDLRLDLVERDDHDRVLAEWEQTLDDATRQRLQSQGYRLVPEPA
jgi:transcriptional regulator with XRE-family HTH domain